MLQFTAMKIVKQTDRYMKWFKRLKDLQAKARIAVRIRRLQNGDVGDAKSVGGDVRELRLHFGPGYRIYFTERNGSVIILLAGGDKSSQTADIKAAIAMSIQIKEA